MLKLVAVDGRTLTESAAVPTTVSFVVTSTDVAAQRASVAGDAVLLAIDLDCTCSGTVGGQNYSGTGSATIGPSTPQLTVEGEEVLLVGDSVTMSCGPSASVTVTVTITDAGQTTVLADD